MNVSDLNPEDPQWEALGNLFGAYLHRDFDLEYGTNPWDTIQGFRDENSVEDVASAARGARVLAQEISDDNEGDLVADKLHLDYSPVADGYTYRGWLIALADFLATGNRPDA